MDEKKYTVDVIIPTYRPDGKIRNLLDRLRQQTYEINKCIIINTDGTGEQTDCGQGTEHMEVYQIKGEEKDCPKAMCIEIHHIKEEEFDHGTTRNFGVTFSDADIVVFMTQDAVPNNKTMLTHLLEPFVDPQVYVSYGRQIPTGDSRPVEAFTRRFNYPDYDIVKTIDSVGDMGIKAYFSSDVCAAYRREAFLKLGGFPRTIFNEDSIFASKVVRNGGKVYYASKAKVVHSHNYTYRQLFQRNFDIGVSHKDFEDIFRDVHSEHEGVKLVKDTMHYLVKKGKWYLIPDTILRSGFKFCGYRLGKAYHRLPKKLVLLCTSTKHYWKKL